VSLGNAYYYFDSKEQLIQGLYDQAAALHTGRLPDALAGLTDFGARLEAHLDLWFELMAPHQPFAVAFFRNAADPTSPLSPFSAESGPARAAAIATLQQVIDGSTIKAS
jgi:AcrR family transcriptional regulator